MESVVNTMMMLTAFSTFLSCFEASARLIDGTNEYLVDERLSGLTGDGWVAY